MTVIQTVAIHPAPPCPPIFCDSCGEVSARIRLGSDPRPSEQGQNRMFLPLVRADRAPNPRPPIVRAGLACRPNSSLYVDILFRKSGSKKSDQNFLVDFSELLFMPRDEQPRRSGLGSVLSLGPIVFEMGSDRTDCIAESEPSRH
jgi:hypothetical protein